jgi:hypothetical protein
VIRFLAFSLALLLAYFSLLLKSRADGEPEAYSPADQSAQQESEEPPAPPPLPPEVKKPGLAHFQSLWNKSVFTTHELPEPIPETPEIPEDDSWARSLVLAGWVELNGQSTAYLHYLEDGRILALGVGEPADDSEGLEVVEVQGTDTCLDLKALVRQNGREAWIKPRDDSPPEGKPKLESTAVKAPTSVDSLAATVTGPVILEGDTPSFGSASEVDPGADPNEEAAPTPIPQASMRRLQERRERLYRNFPRSSEQ